MIRLISRKRAIGSSGRQTPAHSRPTGGLLKRRPRYPTNWMSRLSYAERAGLAAMQRAMAMIRARVASIFCSGLALRGTRSTMRCSDHDVARASNQHGIALRAMRCPRIAASSSLVGPLKFWVLVRNSITGTCSAEPLGQLRRGPRRRSAPRSARTSRECQTRWCRSPIAERDDEVAFGRSASEVQELPPL